MQTVRLSGSSVQGMYNPIAFALTFSIGIHIVLGLLFVSTDELRLPVSADAPVQHITVDLLQRVKSEPAPSETTKHVVTTIAQSELKLVVTESVLPRPVKLPQKIVQKEVVRKPQPKPEDLLASKSKRLQLEDEQVQDLPVIPAKPLVASDVESKSKKVEGAGSSSEYRLIQEPNLRGKPSSLRYPYRARKMGQEGTVILEVKLDTLGMIVSMEIEKTSGYKVLDKAAQAAVSRWRFLPLIENGQALRSRVRIPVRFKLS